MNCLDSKIPENKSDTFFTYMYMTAPSAVMWTGHVTQNLRNSSVLCHKTKNPFEAKICLKN